MRLFWGGWVPIQCLRAGWPSQKLVWSWVNCSFPAKWKWQWLSVHWILNCLSFFHRITITLHFMPFIFIFPYSCFITFLWALRKNFYTAAYQLLFLVHKWDNKGSFKTWTVELCIANVNSASSISSIFDPRKSFYGDNFCA